MLATHGMHHLLIIFQINECGLPLLKFFLVFRTKRSSAQAISSVVSKASTGLQSKVGFLGQASAGAVSFLTSASSKSGHGDDHHGYSYEPVSVDIY